MTLSNTILLVTVLGVFLLVFAMHKLEDPYSVNFLSSSYLPRNPKRRELVVTTARVPPKRTHTQKCGETQVLELSSSSTKLQRTLSYKNVTAKKQEKMKTARMYLPAIRILYTPKNPRPLRLKKEEKTQKTAQNPTKRFDPESAKRNEVIPDVYRLAKSHYNRSGTVNRIVRNTHTDSKYSCDLDQWHLVNKEKHKVMVYSAYWDDRFENPYVRVMAIMLTKNSPTIYCRFKMADGSHIDATSSKKIMNEHWRLKYASYFVSCPLSKNHTPPITVSLSTDVQHTEAAVLPVHNNKKRYTSERNGIAVCVKPLHYNYDRATWLLEFLELHRMLGVEHFFFYNHTVGPNVDAVLRRYIDLGLVTAMPWHIGIRSQKEIRTEAIFSSLNDCLFRTMYHFKYVIMLDFDEYIVPRDHDTYSELLQQLEKDNKQIRGRPGSFVFRNVFFYLYWENDTTVFGVPPEKPPDWLPYLITQYKTRRLSSSMKPGSRSKYIVVPERAVEVGNHVVWRHTSGSRSINVPDNMALLHHYRICEFGGFSCLKKNSVVDQVAQRFGPELLDRVRSQCKATFPGGQCPLSPPLGSPW